MKTVWAISLSIILSGVAIGAGFDFEDFSSVEDWTFVADAAQVGDRLRLTPATFQQRGAAWYASQVSVNRGFRMRFQFQMSDVGAFPDVTCCAGGDGFAFVIQNDDLNAIGDYGYGIGYSATEDGADSIANSVALEFDTWRNTQLEDPNDNHLSVHTRGVSKNNPHESYSLGSTTNLPDLESGAAHTVAIEYVPGVMDIFLNDLQTPTLTVPLNLDTTLDLDQGHAWIGFTSSTWAGWANHDILSASFHEIPEPSSGWLGGCCLLAVVLIEICKRGTRLRCASG